MGNHEILYSVFPFFMPHALGPMPIEKVMTPTLNALKAMKWPSSWKKMSPPKTSTMARAESQ